MTSLSLFDLVQFKSEKFIKKRSESALFLKHLTHNILFKNKTTIYFWQEFLFKNEAPVVKKSKLSIKRINESHLFL